MAETEDNQDNPHVTIAEAVVWGTAFSQYGGGAASSAQFASIAVKEYRKWKVNHE